MTTCKPKLSSIQLSPKQKQKNPISSVIIYEKDLCSISSRNAKFS